MITENQVSLRNPSVCNASGLVPFKIMLLINKFQTLFEFASEGTCDFCGSESAVKYSSIGRVCLRCEESLGLKPNQHGLLGDFDKLVEQIMALESPIAPIRSNEAICNADFGEFFDLGDYHYPTSEVLDWLDNYTIAN